MEHNKGSPKKKIYSVKSFRFYLELDSACFNIGLIGKSSGTIVALILWG